MTETTDEGMNMCITNLNFFHLGPCLSLSFILLLLTQNAMSLHVAVPLIACKSKFSTRINVQVINKNEHVALEY